MTIRKICVITGSRSDYGLFYPILKKIQGSSKLKLQLIATSSHHSDSFGMTTSKIEEDGFFIDEKIRNLTLTDKRSSIAKSAGAATSFISDALEKLEPDIVLLLGDRYETHAAATSALLMNIPIAHIHGGEITEGAVDEQLRHSITKMSYLHFCSTEIYRQRIIQMGEDQDRVFNFGAPGIDNIISLDLLTKTQLQKELNWKFSDECALFTYHPVTLEMNNIENDLDLIFKTIEKFKFNTLFTYANADFGGNIINDKIEFFCKNNPKKYHVVKNLGQVKYLSSMNCVDLLIGNSSSGIIESASFSKPAVNIGERQKGRIKNENVIDCKIKNLEESIELALSDSFRKKIKNIKNVYGSGNTAEQIVQKLITEPLSLIKKFKDKP